MSSGWLGSAGSGVWRRIVTVAACLAFLHSAVAQADPPEIAIGVQLIRSPERTLAAWAPTAAYLTQAIPGYRFRIEPLDTEQLNEAVAGNRLEFVLTNPAHYVFLESRYRLNRIATLVKSWNEHPLREFGGVVIVRADRSDLKQLTDLKGKRVSAVGDNWLGAYQAQATELLAKGVDPQRDIQLQFTGEPQDRVVRDVLEKRADAGFVRSGLIEEMYRDSDIDQAGLRILNPRKTGDFPQFLSTALYPEWPFAVSVRTPTRLANLVAVALLGMPPESQAAIKGEYRGWSIPADYQPVHDLVRSLRLPPYDTRPEFSVRDVVRRYEAELFAGLALTLIAAVLLLLRFQRMNRTIVEQVTTATRQADELASEVAIRRKVEENLRLSASVFEHANDGVMISDSNNVIVDVNAAFSAITGYEREEVIGRNPSILQSGRQSDAFYHQMWQCIADTGRWRGEIWNRRKSGEFFVELLDITAVRNPEGQITHHVAVFSDITMLRSSQERLEHMAHYDPLTQLPNRTLLADRLNQAVAHAERDDHLLAVCFVDLDGFKPINDEYGHQVGDRLLIDVARRLEITLRAVDTVARLGGDEFVLLLTTLADTGELENVLDRVMEVIEQPFHIEQHDIRISASLGVTLYPIDDADPESLLRHADQAMYQAKRSGRSRYSIFDASQDKEVQSRLHSIERIRIALADNEFVLYYQPKVDMRQGKVVGLEALIRWQHPQRGIVLPGEFLPLIEQTEVIAHLDEWVIKESLRQLAVWQEVDLALPVSVNVSAKQLQSVDFVETVRSFLADRPRVPPSMLEFEILESAALGDIEGVRNAIRNCQGLGTHFSLDDFGTGYSSLSYLKRLPVDTIKIDQSFVRDLLDNPEDLAIVEGIVGLARVFQREVVGEGVESAEHGVMLMRLGCDIAQGYGIARPMPAADVVHWCRHYRPNEQWATWADVEWNLADFPLLIAQGDHVRWVKMITRLAENATMPSSIDQIVDHHHCRFGRWYDAGGKERYGASPEFVAIGPIHEEIHGIGREILRLIEAGETELARQRLPRLNELRDEILALLATLQRTVVRHIAEGMSASTRNDA